MIWFVASAVVAVALGLAIAVFEDTGDGVGTFFGTLLVLGILSLFTNLFLSYSGEHRVLEHKCNLKPVANGAYVAFVKDNVVYQCEGDLVPTQIDNHDVKILSGGPTASTYVGEKKSRWLSVFYFKSDSRRTYIYTPNGIAATSVPK